VVRVNGHHSAWPAKFGSHGPYEAEVGYSPYRLANTSISLIVRQGGDVLLHVLVDVGLGVVNSLLELQQASGIDRVDAVVLTHPHFDHVAGLDWLLASCSRSTVIGQPWPLPVYCTNAAFESVFGGRGLFHWWRKSVDFRPVKAKIASDIEGRAGSRLRLSAVPVEHGPTAPGAVIYSVDFESPTGRRRIGIAWDMLRLLPDADPKPMFGLRSALCGFHHGSSATGCEKPRFTPQLAYINRRVARIDGPVAARAHVPYSLWRLPRRRPAGSTTAPFPELRGR